MVGHGGRRQFVAFAEAQMPALLRLAFVLTGDGDAAQDVVQTALEKIFVHWVRVERASSPEAYVRRVVVNAAMDHGRKRRDVPTEFGPEALVTAAGSARVDSSVDLRRSLDALPERQRAVVVLRFYLDLSEREIAETLGIGVGTVKSHASRGLASLRRDLSDFPSEPHRALD